MDREVEGRPPPIVEAAVRLLVPPVSREHVMGDLSERYTSRGSYLIDVLTTVPFVIASRVRRTTSVPWLIFRLCMLWFAVFHGSMQKNWLIATIPTLLCAAVFIMRDAYRGLTPRWVRDAAIDIALALAVTLAWQAIALALIPEVALPRETLFTGVPLGFFVMFFVRLQAPTGYHYPQVRRMSLQELLGEIHTYETLLRRGVRIEVGAVAVVTVAFTAIAWVASHATTKIGCGITAAGALFVGWFLIRYAGVHALAAGAGFDDAMAHYRVQIERRKRLARTYVWWYITPLLVGPAIMMLAEQLGRPDPLSDLAAELAGLALFVLLLIFVQKDGMRRAQQRLDQLAATTEKI